jgi:lysophospholipase L1-like esterase
MSAVKLRLRAALCAAVAFGVLLPCVTGSAGAAGPASGSPKGSPTHYYLALGDSLSTGGGATKGHGYVDNVFAFASRSIPGLTLENLGCGGDSTTRMISGGLCHNYTTGNQLGDAEAFLRAHPRQVSFVTLDVGGDDIVGCGLSGTINATCVQRALAHVETNLPIIVKGLRAAGGRVPIVGMTYYDPLLAFYLKGSTGQQTAVQSIGVLLTLNRDLAKVFRRYGVRIANGQRAFDSTDWRLNGSFNGLRLPRNVANVCNWTHMCEANPNIHANDIGHQKLTAAFEARLRGVVRPARATR